MCHRNSEIAPSYQDKAVEKLKAAANSLIELQDNKIIAFDAPTDSSPSIPDLRISSSNRELTGSA
ncbi:MAG: hypothetical protein HY757_04710 [Nitrospirae bacterium]|nr:hypothetical protein [Nitrospirota bacterium]